MVRLGLQTQPFLLTFYLAFLLSTCVLQLIIGNFGLSEEQSRSQMALWTILAAPLFLSTDLRTISQSSRKILQNKLMIKINQDPLGIQGRRILQVREAEAWIL